MILFNMVVVYEVLCEIKTDQLVFLSTEVDHLKDKAVSYFNISIALQWTYLTPSNIGSWDIGDYLEHRVYVCTSHYGKKCHLLRSPGENPLDDKKYSSLVYWEWASSESSLKLLRI